MIAALTTLHRRYPALLYLALGAVLTAFIPFPPATKVGVRIFFSLLIWLMISAGIWQIAGLPKLARDIALLFRKSPSSAAPTPPLHHKGPLPTLTPARQTSVRKTVAIMAEHGIFAPENPDPALLYAGVAEMDESVKPDTILAALGEADHYHPGTDPAAWTANLVMHDSKAEQDEAKQIADLVRLAKGGLDVRDLRIERGEAVGRDDRAIPLSIAMTVNGEATVLNYMGDAKYLSTHIHHALATRLDAAATGHRLAWLWTDQGAWISALPSGAVEAMNGAFKLTPQSRCHWAWVSEEEPFAAGDARLGREET